MFHDFYSTDNFAARLLYHFTSFPLQTMLISLLLSEAIVGCHFPDGNFLANCKDQVQEGWVRSHTVCSKVWSYSRNHLLSDTPSCFALGTASELPLNTQSFLWILTEKKKRNKKAHKKTVMDSGQSQAFSTIFCSGTESWDFPRHLISVPMYHFHR